MNNLESELQDKTCEILTSAAAVNGEAFARTVQFMHNVRVLTHMTMMVLAQAKPTESQRNIVIEGVSTAAAALCADYADVIGVDTKQLPELTKMVNALFDSVQSTVDQHRTKEGN